MGSAIGVGLGSTGRDWLEEDRWKSEKNLRCTTGEEVGLAERSEMTVTLTAGDETTAGSGVGTETGSGTAVRTGLSAGAGTGTGTGTGTGAGVVKEEGSRSRGLGGTGEDKNEDPEMGF